MIKIIRLFWENVTTLNAGIKNQMDSLLFQHSLSHFKDLGCSISQRPQKGILILA